MLSFSAINLFFSTSRRAICKSIRLSHLLLTNILSVSSPSASCHFSSAQTQRRLFNPSAVYYSSSELDMDTIFASQSATARNPAKSKLFPSPLFSLLLHVPTVLLSPLSLCLYRAFHLLLPYTLLSPVHLLSSPPIRWVPMALFGFSSKACAFLFTIYVRWNIWQI